MAKTPTSRACQAMQLQKMAARCCERGCHWGARCPPCVHLASNSAHGCCSRLGAVGGAGQCGGCRPYSPFVGVVDCLACLCCCLMASHAHDGYHACESAAFWSLSQFPPSEFLSLTFATRNSHVRAPRWMQQRSTCHCVVHGVESTR